MPSIGGLRAQIIANLIFFFQTPQNPQPYDFEIITARRYDNIDATGATDTTGAIFAWVMRRAVGLQPAPVVLDMIMKSVAAYSNEEALERLLEATSELVGSKWSRNSEEFDEECSTLFGNGAFLKDTAYS